jgi:predicted transposase/invertase (TIGR01784 family)
LAKLKYTFKHDTLFKMLFVKYPELLKRLTARLLGIELGSIGQFDITNPEMPPENLGDKFCRLDINMTVNEQRVDLEIQVNDEGDYPERSLYNWAREFSSSLAAGGEYIELPRTVIISIVAFRMFKCKEFHSEFQALEVTRHTPLTDKMSMHYFELPKLPDEVSADDELRLWLALFKANTEEELRQIEELEVPIMQEAIGAYHSVTATNEFKEIERLRELARHNEASALGNARRKAEARGLAKGIAKGEAQERAKWQSVVAEKDALIAKLQAKTAAEQK